MIKATSTLAPSTSSNLFISSTSDSAPGNPPVLKKCPKCGKTLPISEFETHNKARDGHRRCCKQCSSHAGQKTTDTPRPDPYTPQPGNKATLSLADFTDENLFAELRRRGYSGQLQYTKTIAV